MMMSLKYMCGKYIHDNLTLFHFTYLPKPLIKYIQTLNPYIYDIYIDEIYVLALNTNTPTFIKHGEARIRNYELYPPPTFNYERLLLSAALNNNLNVVEFIVCNNNSRVTDNEIWNVIIALKQLKLKHTARYLYMLYHTYRLEPNLCITYLYTNNYTIQKLLNSILGSIPSNNF